MGVTSRVCLWVVLLDTARIVQTPYGKWLCGFTLFFGFEDPKYCNI
jgi:hypothetical protein